MSVEDLAMPDYFNIPNALFRFQSPVSTPAEVAFDLEWRGPITERRSVSDATNGFEGEFLANHATMGWSAHSADFSFASDPARTSTSVQALLGSERNGRFFGTDASDGED